MTSPSKQANAATLKALAQLDADAGKKFASLQQLLKDLGL